MAFLVEIPRRGARMLLLLIFAAFLLNLPNPCFSGDRFRINCSTDGNYSQKSYYKFNLYILLEEMRLASPKTRFYEQKQGKDQAVYGSYLCLANLPSQKCYHCVSEASDDIIRNCPNQVQAKIWYDDCILQHSGDKFFGNWIQDYTTSCDKVDFGTTRLEPLSNSINTTLSQVAQRAATDKSRFATKKVNLNSVSVYTLAQCMPDLSTDLCSQCLNQILTDDHIIYQCQGKTGGRTVSSSCTIRYQTFPFYGEAPAPAPTPPPLPIQEDVPAGSTNWDVTVDYDDEPTPPPLPIQEDVPAGSPNGGGTVDYDDEPIMRVRRRSPHVREIVFLGITVSGVTLLILGIWYYVRKSKPLNDFEGLDTEEIRMVETLQMDFNKVRAATQNFAAEKKLGEGGFGNVYKGTLENGQDIAVKRLIAGSEQGTAEFKNEVLLVAKLQHRNLVKLLGFCLSGNEKILVYEYLPNSSLDKVLFDPTKRATLDWQSRFSIICGIAKGLLYLHQDSRLRIIHRDLKTSNILLDEVMSPKISDFGIAKMLSLDQTRASTDTFAGTYGYMAPEYMLIGQYSLKSDIYSFGIIVLEIVSGQRNRFCSRPLLEEALLHRAWRLWSENAMLEMVDSTLNHAYSSEEVMKCIHIGLLCIQVDAAKRPTMTSIAAALSGKSMDLPPPTPPNFFDVSCSSSTATTATGGTQPSMPPSS